MIDRSAGWIAEASAARLELGDAATPGPSRVVCDSRQVAAGDLFVGLEGERVDGGKFAASALAAGAWGVLVSCERARELIDGGYRGPAPVLCADNPAASLGLLARTWRRELGCPVIAITGSTGKTSTKDILAALLAPHRRTHANRANLNTEIGLPLAVLEAEPGVEVLVLEMAMRGPGQIAELCRIAEPDVGVIVNIGPVHLEVLGTVERIAAAKAELIANLPAGAPCVVPAHEPLLEPHLRDDLDTITFGPGGDVSLASFADGVASVDLRGRRLELELSYAQPYNLSNTLAAAAAAAAIGVTPGGVVDVGFSAMRGEVVELAGGAALINDCYNANPMSMHAALEYLAQTPAQRRIAVLGEMAELGPQSREFHLAVGQRAADLGIDILICVGDVAAAYGESFTGETYTVPTPEEASELVLQLAQSGDWFLVKGSRSAGLERVLI